jgi:hypothetical protein
VQGYFNYHAIPGNLASLRRFRIEVRKRWLHVIRRRSQKSRMTWEPWRVLPSSGFPYPRFFIHIPLCALTPSIRGKSRVR